MNVGIVPYQAFPSFGLAITASQSGRMAMPVSPSSYIYSQFKHVSGVPAPEGVKGVNINKLKIIDALIEQISKMKNMPEFSAIDSEENISDKRINALIEQYNNQVKNIRAAGMNNPYAQVSSLIGAVFSISI